MSDTEQQTQELKGVAIKTLGPAGVVLVGLLGWMQTGISDLRDQMVPRGVFEAKLDAVVESQRDMKLTLQLLDQRVQGIESELSYFRGAAEAVPDKR